MPQIAPSPRDLWLDHVLRQRILHIHWVTVLRNQQDQLLNLRLLEKVGDGDFAVTNVNCVIRSHRPSCRLRG